MIYGTPSSHRHYQGHARLADGRGFDEIHIQKVDLVLRQIPSWYALLGCGTGCHRLDLGASLQFQGVRSAPYYGVVSGLGGRGGSSRTVAQDRDRLDKKICAGSGVGGRDSSGQWEVSRPSRGAKCEGRQAAPVAPSHGDRDVQDGLHRAGPRRQGRRVAGIKILFQNRQAARCGFNSHGNTGAAL